MKRLEKIAHKVMYRSMPTRISNNFAYHYRVLSLTAKPLFRRLTTRCWERIRIRAWTWS